MEPLSVPWCLVLLIFRSLVLSPRTESPRILDMWRSNLRSWSHWHQGQVSHFQVVLKCCSWHIVGTQKVNFRLIYYCLISGNWLLDDLLNDKDYVFHLLFTLLSGRVIDRSLGNKWTPNWSCMFSICPNWILRVAGAKEHSWTSMCIRGKIRCACKKAPFGFGLTVERVYSHLFSSATF